MSSVGSGDFQKNNPMRGSTRQFTLPARSLSSTRGPASSSPANRPPSTTTNAFQPPRSPDLLRPTAFASPRTYESKSPYERASPDLRAELPGQDIEQQAFRKNIAAYADRSSSRSPKYDPLRAQLEDPTMESSTPGSGRKLPISKAALPVNPPESVFHGINSLQYALFAHYMTLGSTMLCLFTGIFAILWDSPVDFRCKIDGQLISSQYIEGNSTLEGYNLCNFKHSSHITGNSGIGSLYVIYSIFLLFVENRSWGFGLYYRNDTISYVRGLSPLCIFHLLFGVIGLGSYCTVLAAIPLLSTAIVLAIAAWRQEAGDGGRQDKAKALADAAKEKEDAMVKNPEREHENCLEKLINAPDRIFAWTLEVAGQMLDYNPALFFQRLVREEKLGSYFWTMLFTLFNLCCFWVVWRTWVDIVEKEKQDLKEGTLNLSCDDYQCKINKQMIISGPLSVFSPWAKASAWCLNLNSHLILLPVTKTLLKRIYNAGTSFHSAQQNSSIFAKFFAGPLIRYFPIHKNLDLHKLCAGAIFFFTWIHMICHYANLVIANDTALVAFKMYGWSYWAYFSGAIMTLCGFYIVAGAPDEVRKSKYEIFITSHYFFVLYFFFMFIHAPSFWAWGVWPVLLYLFDRYLASYRGLIPFVVIKVEWISPVMAIYFRPLVRDSFNFKEGQYVNLNCPGLSKTEWHPFTVSSARDDLDNGCRIHLASGEEVVEVPRPPANIWPADARWNKYCRVSQDWRAMQVNAPHQLLDKADTGYFDMMSVHVKVHGIGSWTRKLKEYFELLSPEKDANGEQIFPIYFTRTDQRGDLILGRQNGPDNKPILRIDGPHSAPTEHYFNYKSVMLVSAGIGITPCASILTSLIRYKWKRNHPTEILQFYWIVRHDEVDSFQWFIHLLTELSFDLKRHKESNQIDKQYYLEINIFVTSAPKNGDILIQSAPLKRSAKKYSEIFGPPSFTADQLYAMLKNPKIDSRTQKEQMSSVATSKNRLQNIWVWNGRPSWDIIFQDMKAQRQHSNIGVCFCGTPAIGTDLKEMCDTYTSFQDDCVFTLHKENF